MPSARTQRVAGPFPSVVSVTRPRELNSPRSSEAVSTDTPKWSAISLVLHARLGWLKSSRSSAFRRLARTMPSSCVIELLLFIPGRRDEQVVPLERLMRREVAAFLAGPWPESGLAVVGEMDDAAFDGAGLERRAPFLAPMMRQDGVEEGIQ